MLSAADSKIWVKQVISKRISVFLHNKNSRGKKSQGRFYGSDTVGFGGWCPQVMTGVIISLPSSVGSVQNMGRKRLGFFLAFWLYGVESLSLRPAAGFLWGLGGPKGSLTMFSPQSGWENKRLAVGLCCIGCVVSQYGGWKGKWLPAAWRRQL